MCPRARTTIEGISDLECDRSQRLIFSSLRKFFCGLAIGSLIGFVVLEFGFTDLEFFAEAIAMAVSNKNKKKKGLVAALGRKTVKKVQSSFWQALERKTKEISLPKPSEDLEECHPMLMTFENDEDSFVTSMTNVNASLPSNSSGSYVTAFCESFGSDDMFRVISPAASGPQLLDEKSREQGSFDADFGKFSPPLPQSVEISDLEIRDDLRRMKFQRRIVSQAPQKSSIESNKEICSVRTILDELQSKAVSENVKAKNLALLNRVILQCKDYMQRCSVRQDLMSLGLFSALPSLIESRDKELESELEIFFASESNDNLMGSSNRCPIDIFQSAYVKLKHSKSAEILLDILELVAKIQPSGETLCNVLHCLQGVNMRSEGVQTETEAENDSCDAVFSQNVSVCTNVQDLALSEFSPMPQAVRRPRSTSRKKGCSRRQQITVANIPFIDDVPAKSFSVELDEKSEEQKCSSKESPKSLHCLPPIEKQRQLSSTKPVASVPAPPPLPPPTPEFLNPSLVKQTPVTGSPVVVKSAPIYKKKCATNTIAWETVKQEMILTRSTVWNDQNGIHAEFNQQERERLEKVFERTNKYNSRMISTQGQARTISAFHKNGTAAGGLMEKRALNLGIVLARFRPLTLEQLVEKIESLAISDLPLDCLGYLLKHFPTPEEFAYFTKLKTADNLKDAELFCFLVARKPLLKLRIELKVLADNIVNDLARQLDCTRLLLTASGELYNSSSINSFFHRCLQYGNFLNQSTFAAGASGFALSSLLPALNTKGSGAAASTRLVDVLAEYADESVRDIVRLLEFLEPAKKYSIDELEKSETSLRHSLEISLKNLQECGDQELYAHYSPILMDSTAKCGQLARYIKKVRYNENRLKDYYCASQMTLENILEILSQAIRLLQASLNKAETRNVSARQMQQKRAGAGQGIVDVRSRHRRNGRFRTYDIPNVKDLIAIINSNECR